MENSMQKKCFLCSSSIDDGICFLKGILCSECEKKIVASSGEEERYTDYMEKIKQVWRGSLSQDSEVRPGIR